MRNIIILLLAFSVITISGDNSFEFINQSFGDIKPLKVICQKTESNMYQKLVYEFQPIGHSCYLTYENDIKIIRQPDGDGKLESIRVHVSARKYDDFLILKHNWFHSRLKDYDHLKVGNDVVNIKGKNLNYTQWISDDYFINIQTHKLGDFNSSEEELIEYYLSAYKPTYTITADDIDSHRINLYEMSRHMEIINIAESYRNILRSKVDKYTAIMAQCHEEMEIRTAAGLCEDAWIDDEDVGCPIAMNFSKNERKKMWKDFEDSARNTSGLNFNQTIDKKCSNIGLQWYQMDVLKKLGFTKTELILMYSSGLVPDAYLPSQEDMMMLFR